MKLISEKTSQFENDISLLNSFMNRNKVNIKLKLQIRKFLEY